VAQSGGVSGRRGHGDNGGMGGVGRTPRGASSALEAAGSGRQRPRAPRVAAPPLPPGASAADLSGDVRRELRELTPERGDAVALHLAAAGALLGDDPELAYRHAAYARSLSARLAAVREAAGLTAYRTGRYAEALNDLRAFARMTGDPRHLPLLADCERGLGRPERALSLARGKDAERLAPAQRVELRIVASGARRDLGEAEAALVELRGRELEQTDVREWTARLWYAYAEALLGVGRPEAALRWFRSAATVDEYGETDADERVEELDPAGGPAL